MRFSFLFFFKIFLAAKRLPIPFSFPSAIPAATTRRLAGKPRAFLTFYFLALRYFQRPSFLPPQTSTWSPSHSPSHCQVTPPPANRQFIPIIDADPLSLCLLRATHLPSPTLLPLVATWTTLSLFFIVILN